jgi:hypothetical protein
MGSKAWKSICSGDGTHIFNGLFTGAWDYNVMFELKNIQKYEKKLIHSHFCKK